MLIHKVVLALAYLNILLTLQLAAATGLLFSQCFQRLKLALLLCHHTQHPYITLHLHLGVMGGGTQCSLLIECCFIFLAALGWGCKGREVAVQWQLLTLFYFLFCRLIVHSKSLGQ